MTEIDRIHDKFFKNTFSNLDNVRTFLNAALPESIRKAIDFSNLEIDFTDYVSQGFKEHFSDMVARTTMTSEKEGKEINIDIYILFEHKSYRDAAIFIQLLLAMYLMWEKDIAENKPLRVIIPLVFYHGREKWNIPRSFAEQFKVSDEIKEFLLDYRYVLFDTRPWDFRKEKNKELGKNVFLLSALALMKSIANDDLDSIVEVFKFWHEKGFTNKEKILFFLTYISETKDIEQKEVQDLLEKVRIEGGDFMPTLAQRLRDEGRHEGMKEGIKEEKLETARRMLHDDFPIESIIKYTGLTEKEIKALMN